MKLLNRIKTDVGLQMKILMGIVAILAIAICVILLMVPTITQ
jgi:hypothetical protein